MSRRDLVFGTNVQQVFPVTSVTGVSTSASINLADNYGAKFVINVGALTVAIIVKVQESDDDSVWTDADASEVVSDSALTAGQLTIGAADDNLAFQLGYVGLKQYSRIATVSGTGSISATGEVEPRYYEQG